MERFGSVVWSAFIMETPKIAYRTEPNQTDPLGGNEANVMLYITALCCCYYDKM